MASAVAPHVGGLKLGLEFFAANGPAGGACSRVEWNDEESEA